MHVYVSCMGGAQMNFKPCVRLQRAKIASFLYQAAEVQEG